VAGCESGNRRTATVISVGYTQLLCLSKRHINDVLEEYPLARERLEEIARKRIVERDQFKLMRHMQRSGSTTQEATNGSVVGPLPMGELVVAENVGHHFQTTKQMATASQTRRRESCRSIAASRRPPSWRTSSWRRIAASDPPFELCESTFSIPATRIHEFSKCDN